MTVTVDAVLDGLRQRRAAAASDAQARYVALVRRLASGTPARTDTPQAVEDMLAGAGRQVADLERDLEAVRRYAALRQRVAALPALEGRAAQLEEALARAVAEERATAARLRAVTTAAREAASDAAGALRELETAREVVEDLAPGELVAAWESARREWLAADYALRFARAAAEDRVPVPVVIGDRPPPAPPPHAPEDLARLELEAGAAYAAMSEAWAALLAAEPDLDALRPGGGL